MKYVVCFLSTVAFALSVSATTPGGLQKKFVALTFDVAFNAPSNVCAHAEELNKLPWLDGVAVSLLKVPVKTVDGKGDVSDTTRLMRLNDIWTRDAVKTQIPYLRGIVKYPRLKESFLLAWISPSGKHNRIAWTDDAGWARFGDNLAVLAWAAKEAGLKGLMLDPEEYSGALQYLYTKADGAVSFSECRELARRRGREVFSKVFKEFPEGIYFFLWTLEHHVRYFAGRRTTDPQSISDDAGELLSYFYNGMFDVMPPTARFVDGAEHYSLTATKDMYWKGAINQLVGARAFVAPENWGRYRAQLLVGNTHYLDMFSIHANPKSHWYHQPVDGSRLNHLRLNLEQSLQSADEYVWIYGECGRLIDWKCAINQNQQPSSRRQLWDDQIPGFTDTITMAKDPEAFLEMRKKDYAARGELKNLAADYKGLPVFFSQKDEKKAYKSRVVRSVKGVCPGDVYDVSQEVRSSMRSGSPTVKVTWRAKGKVVAEDSEKVLPCSERIQGESRWMRDMVLVPAGADELVVEFSAELAPGESANARSTEVYLVDEAQMSFTPAPVKEYRSAEKTKGGKWVFDEKKKRLSNGHWSLGANYLDKARTRLGISGIKAEGSGVLDFTGVEKDTGKKVASIGSFARNVAITELIGPDIEIVGMDAMRFCYNLRRVEISPAVKQLTTSCFAYCTNLVSFSPLTLPADVRLAGISQFQSCTALKSDFVYEGAAPLAGAMFAGSGITSLRAPKCANLLRNSLSGCRNLTYLRFADDVKFSNEAERRAYMQKERRTAGAMPNLISKTAKGFETLKSTMSKIIQLSPRPIVKDVREGELYGVSISSRRTAWSGSCYFRVKWLKDGRQLAWSTERPFSMSGLRENGVWRTGSILVRVPPEANQFVLEVGATLMPGESIEYDKIEIYKLGNPPPAWPQDK